MKRTTRYLNGLLIATLLLLAACGGSDPEPGQNVGDGLAKFEEQEVNWTACDPDLFPEDSEEGLAVLGDRLECATFKTPLDWNEPAREEINLGVLRVRAGDLSQRQGAIFMNPGGPGGDGLTFGALFGLIFANGGVEEVGRPAAAPELLAQVSERYDVLGFSPRGLGGSFQLFCGTNEPLPPANFYTDRSEENVQTLLAQARLTAEACENNPLADFITTEQTVRDMDLIRRLLGDEKLNYLGYSYGSWLGAWYAKRFPEHAGNIVLDANVDFSKTWTEANINFIKGFQRGFEEVAAPYLARNNAVFGLGETEEEVYGVYAGLRENLKAVVALPILSNLYSSGDVPFVGDILVASEGISTILDELEPLTPETYEAFLDGVAAYPYSEDEERNATLSELALDLAQGYLQTLEPQPIPAVLEPSDAVLNAVICNETLRDQGPEFYAEQGDQLNESYPYIGGSFSTSLLLPSSTCAFWGEPTAAMPDLPETTPPVLMVQSGYDSPTVAEGALEAFRSLPNAGFVYVENELSHGVFPYNTECVDAKVARFLIDGTLPESAISTCDALPLPGESEVFPPGTAPNLDGASTSGLSVQAAQSAGENDLYDLVHDIIRTNAADFFSH